MFKAATRLLCLGLVLAAEVVDFGDNNATIINNGEPWLLFLFAPWCQVCAAVEPIFSSLAARYEGRTRFARGDATAHPGLAERYNVRGFPTLVAVAAGRHIDYRGPRDEDSLARVADRIAAAPITPLPAEAALDEAATTFVACGPGVGTSEAFEESAARLRLENQFHAAASGHARCAGDGVIMAYSQGRVYAQTAADDPGLAGWIHAHRLGVVRELGRGNGSTVGLHQIEDAPRPLVVLATVGGRCTAVLSEAAWRATDAAHALHDAYGYVWIDAGTFATFVGNTLGLAPADVPRVAVYNVRDNTYALGPPGAECDARLLEEFLGRVKAGAVEMRGGALERWAQWAWGLGAQATEFAADNPGAATTTLVMVGLVVYALTTMPDYPANDGLAFTKAEAALNAAFDVWHRPGNSMHPIARGAGLRRRTIDFSSTQRGADAATIERLKAAVLAERSNKE